MKLELKEFEEKMKKSVAGLESEYATISAGRASASVLDRVQVEYFGSNMPINQVAEIKMADPRTLVISPWDASCLKNIEKAILASDLGINPQNDGKVIRLIFPPLTEDRRKEIVKDVQKIAEETKIQIRNARRDTIEKLKAMKKAGELTEDDLKQGEKKTQDLTDKYIKNIDKLSADKQKEILEM